MNEASAGTWSPASVREGLRGVRYLADEALSTVVYLAFALRRPLFVEGEPGVGKTELATSLADMLGSSFHRLQCYEGIDAAQALYEWNHARQLLHLRAEAVDEVELYSERFLLRRPLLRALGGAPSEPPPVLLIDEVDRADDEFEAFLLEVLSDFAVTIPELGTVRSANPPVVVMTSNRTRDVHDALKRRSLYHWLEQPDVATELAIVRLRAPHVEPELAASVARAVAVLRTIGLYKPPGIAETVDWAVALDALGASSLDAGLAEATLGAAIKYREDLARVREVGVSALVAQATDAT